MKDEQVKAILDDMRRITMLTGELSSVHEESLGKWPFIVFDNVESLEIDYDLTKAYTKEVGEGYVHFMLKGPKNNDITDKAERLTAWVRDMFWNEIEVSVSIDGKRRYLNSTLKHKAAPKQFKETKSYNEAVKEVKNGPKQEG